ncbi:Flagellar brake protein YcgR [Planctomycetes bacterium Poly30]|uniref:Flagellar brake protein YcgR n=1 Tax=Saltatorellus ferox TaxID=2528018 RepID=A0A518EN42_9BACT|nr:Flagellar brake protein YcgR [Planctomycetes bacterium Poly30]
MLRRLFTKNAPEDQRVHYRRIPGKSAAMGVKLICANGAPVSGALIDLSAGGVAIEFDEDLTQELEIGSERELIFSSLTVKSVRALGIVRMVPNERTPKRFGFEFTDGAALFQQLDDSFYKYFNRRQFRRAKPALGEKVYAEFGWGNILQTVDIYDLSRGGASFYVPHDLAAQLELDMPVELVLRVPKTDFTLVHYAIVRHVTQDSRGFRVGVSMEVVTEGENKRNVRKGVAAYSDYLQARIAEMDRYNSAYH